MVDRITLLRSRVYRRSSCKYIVSKTRASFLNYNSQCHNSHNHRRAVECTTDTHSPVGGVCARWQTVDLLSGDYQTSHTSREPKHKAKSVDIRADIMQDCLLFSKATYLVILPCD